MATLQIARDGAPFHVLRYKPSNRPLDYFVAYQAGFALRFFTNDPHKRFNFSPTGSGEEVVETLITAGQQLTVNVRELLPQFAKSVAYWALMNLRSLPVGMRIDQWIHTSFPALRVLQAEGIATMQQQNADILSHQIGNLTVPSVMLSPNAAYALFCDRLSGKTAYGIAYEATGAIDDGRKLLALWDAIPNDPSQDWNLVNAWAENLGMRSWYRLIPYKA